MNSFNPIFIIMIIWAIIVNAQPTTSFVYLGIEWKENGLVNTLFWISILMAILGGAHLTYEERNKRKERDWDE